MIGKNIKKLRFVFYLALVSLAGPAKVSAQFVSPPNLVSPGNGSSNLSQPITLTWDHPGASYHVQVSTDASFNNLIVDVGGITDNNYVINGLANNSTFYWRVNATQLLFTSDWSSVWNFTTAAEQTIPSVPTLASPSDGSIDQPTTIILNWNPATNAEHYWLQVAQDQSFSNITIGNPSVTGTSYQLNNLSAESTYYWRVKSVNSAGESAWSSVWSFTTVSSQIDPPPQPTLVSPSNAAVNQPTTITFTWSPASNADHYSIQVASDQTFSNMVYTNYSIVGTSQQVSGLANKTTYYWQVKAANAGGESPWSTKWSFTTAEPSILAAPTLSAPANNSTGQAETLTLMWNSVTNADKYRLQVSKNNTFSNIVFDDSAITNDYKQVGPLEKGVKHFWRVRAKNNSSVSNWSPVWNFTTSPGQTIPSVPNLVSPANGTMNESLYPVLTWESLSSAASYRLQVAEDAAFSIIVFDDSTITLNYHQTGPLRKTTQHFWRVNAKNQAGTSGWSVVWSFTTLNNENYLPVLISPADGIRNLALSTLCVWDSVESAQQYEIEVSENPDFSTLYIDDVTTKTYKQLDNLTSYTTYFWRVRAKVGDAWHQFTSSWQFTTRSSEPTYANIDTTITFPLYEDISKYKSSDYKIIGIPGISSIPIINFLTGEMNKDWLAYWDNGRPFDYLIDYNETDFFYSIGKAFWIIKKGPIKITATIENAPVNNRNNVEVPLHDGWNLITNPFTTTVQWDDVKTLNSVTEPIYSFEGSYQISETLAPFSGYYFFNATNLSTLEIPSASSTQSSKVLNKSFSMQGDDNGWIANVQLHADNNVDSIAWFGVSSLVTNEYNHLNIHKPRNWGSLPSVYCLRPEWDKDYPVFASDIKPLFESKYEWTFEIKSVPWKPVSLRFDFGEAPASYNIFLYNTVLNKWIDLKEDATRENNDFVYQFTPVTEKTSFKILVGKETEDKLTATVPTDFILGNNYPNPFNLSTTIPVTIPERANVEIAIFNIIGAQIKTIYKGTLEPGNHWFRWDGKDNNGNVISSGVYFYTFQVGSSARSGHEFQKTKKMVLMK